MVYIRRTSDIFVENINEHYYKKTNEIVFYKIILAGVAKLVKAHGLGPCGETLGGSSPPIRTR